MRRILLLAALVTLPAGCATTEHHIGMPLDAGAGRLLTNESWLMGAGAITGSLIGAVIGGGIADRDAYVFAPTTATGSSPTEAALDR
ncbi:MAG: hypothetical protein R3B81_05345 [bacterium]